MIDLPTECSLQKGIGIGHVFFTCFYFYAAGVLKTEKNNQVNVKDKAFGWTPIHFAAHLGSSHLVKLLADPWRVKFSLMFGAALLGSSVFFSVGGAVGNYKKPLLSSKD